MLESSPQIIPSRPPGLIKAIAEKQAILFVGAGISISEGLPGYKDLLTRLVESAERYLKKPEYEELKRAINEHKFTFVADAIQERMSEGFYDTLVAILDHSPKEPSPLHKRIAKMPLAAIVTTNYDQLIENACLREGKLVPMFTATDANSVVQALKDREFFIFKTHGDIKHRETIVLLESDYREVKHRQLAYLRALETIFINMTVLFVGASLTDPDVKLVLETLKESFRQHSPLRHYALIHKDSAGELERRFWQKYYGIELLLYEDHAHVDLFLETLYSEAERIKKSADAWDERVPEAKWYPSKKTLKRIQKEMDSQVTRLLGCGFPIRKPMIEEANILFDTPTGVLFKNRINLSIKVIASRKDEEIENLEARWFIIKLLTFGDPPDKYWDTDRKGKDDDPYVFPYSGDIRSDLKEIVSKLQKPLAIKQLLSQLNLTQDVSPAVVIAVNREQWDFAPGVKWKTGLTLYISHVNVHPYAQNWLEKLSGGFDALQSEQFNERCAWDELEIEEHGNGGEGMQEFSSRFSDLESEYYLDSPSNADRPVAKYHNSIKILRRLWRSQKAPKRDYALFEGWPPFMRVGE